MAASQRRLARRGRALPRLLATITALLVLGPVAAGGVVSASPAAATVGDDTTPFAEARREFGDEQFAVTAPAGGLTAVVALRDGRPTYAVGRGPATVVEPSSLGFELQGAPALLDDFEVDGTERRSIDETWEPVWGRQSSVRNRAEELVVHLRQSTTQRRLDLTFRVFDDGIGFRYTFPEQPELDSFTVTAEHTEFRLPRGATAWSIPAGTSWEADETLYREQPVTAVASAQTPMTLQAGNDLFLAVHEADLTDYPSMTLRALPGVLGGFRSDLVALPGGAKAHLSAPFATPWRTLTVGADAGDLAESYLLENLNDPCAICDGDTTWIRPALYVGVWWELQRRFTTWNVGPNHGATTERVQEYIDFAAAHDIPYVLAEGWNTNSGGTWAGQDWLTPNDDFDLEGVIAYGERRGVGFVAHNETRGYVDDYEAGLERIYSRYEELGIHAVKTGYATRFRLGGVDRSHYDQEAVRHYQRVIDTAARHRITINAHEAIKPTGKERTYPNMMTGEGARGTEFHNYGGRNGNPPQHSTILPFTRFLGGPMDYTPGIFDVTWDPARLGTRVQSTRANQLALYPTFFSPLQMLADLPEHYEGEAEFAYFDGMPTTWDESHVLDSRIGDHVVTARRQGEAWYVGSVTDEQARRLDVALDFLGAGRWVADIYTDGPTADWTSDPTAVEIRRVLVDRDDRLVASMARAGGQAVRLVPATAQDQATVPDYVAPMLEPAAPDAPRRVEEGSTLSVTTTVSNTGSLVDAAPMQLYLDGEPVGPLEVMRIGGGEERTLTVDVVMRTTGVHELAVGGPEGPEGPVTRVSVTRARTAVAVEIDDVTAFEAGGVTPVRATVSNDGPAIAEDLDVTLLVPDGWSARRVSEGPSRLRRGATATTDWDVTAPAGASGEATVVASVTYRSSGGHPQSRSTQVTAPVVPPPGVVWLSDIDWISATNGVGKPGPSAGPVERDRSVGSRGASDGRPITLDGQVYPKGLGVHAGSEISYSLDGRCSSFTAQVGLDDESGAPGTVAFTVLTDGESRVTTPVMGVDSATIPVSVDVAGTDVLVLRVTDGGDGVDWDHGDWADARVFCEP